MLECDVEGYFCEQAHLKGYGNRKLKFVGRDGAPDRMFFKKKRVFFVEFKRPGKPLNPRQARERKSLVSYGLEVYHISTIGRCDEILNTL
jgi:hypothetical protein